MTTETSAAPKRRITRRGRWTYDSDSTRYGVAGWHLDGSPLVLDFMPGYADCGPGRGMSLLYNWVGREHEPVSTHVRHAMEVMEAEWDALTDEEREVVALEFAVVGPVGGQEGTRA